MDTHILVVDDDIGILSALNLLLKSEGYTVTSIQSPTAALHLLTENDFDLVLTDLNFSRDTTSGEEGLAFVQTLSDKFEHLPVVVMTGWASIEIAVQAMQLGAGDFIEKPWDNERLLSIINNQTKLGDSLKKARRLETKNQLLQQQAYPNPLRHLIIQSPIMKHTLAVLDQVAQSDATVLLTGENGTGKSLFARYVHDRSQRNQGDFIGVNMGAITDTLFESELFGHVKGAFTDAKTERIGRFELAEQGTLFLDEIANTPYSQQMKLLRVLEERQFERVGGNKTLIADVRLITATNADLKVAIAQGKFRKDLLYRINTVEVEIPPLRALKEDILPLAQSFLDAFSAKNSQITLTLTPCAEQTLISYDWPGNVRELRHVIERAYILAQGKTIDHHALGITTELQSLPSNPLTPPHKPASSPESSDHNDQVEQQPLLTLETLEALAIEKRLTHFKGNALLTAKSLGLSRSALYRRLEKLEDKLKPL